MAPSSPSDDDVVVLELTDPCAVDDQSSRDEISISTSDIHSWNLDLILCSRIVKVHANRSRLVEESCYFRGLLSGSFSESSLHQVSVQWNTEGVLSVLRYIHGHSLNVMPDNFLLLLEAALYFGVDNLYLECETWFRHITSVKDLHIQQMPLEMVLEIWKFGREHGIKFVQELCESYLSQHFAWASSCSSFGDIPYDLLLSCLEHPWLTVECEKQLCEALETWLANNNKSLDGLPSNSSIDKFDILKKVKVSLLPLEYAAGLRRRLLQFADEVICSILNLLKDSSYSLMHAVTRGDTEKYRIRLTQYSEIVLSGCTHLTAPFLFLAVLPHGLDVMQKARIIRALVELDGHRGDYYRILEKSPNILCFGHVNEVNISMCLKMNFGAAIAWLHMAFPSLKILKASHCLHFTMEDLFYLIRKCLLMNEVDLTVDVSPVTPTISVLSATVEGSQFFDGKPRKNSEKVIPLSNIGKYSLGKPVVANISKLTLEGRNDITDSDLLCISILSDSLDYLNIKGCTMVTDMGISNLICKCRKVHSLVLSYTSFGRISILTLCSSNTSSDGSHGVYHCHKHSDMMAFGLQQLHLDSCKGVDQTSMAQLMSHTYMLKILSLKDTCLIDDALYEFMGSSLESLDVSETMVSSQALTHIIKMNPRMRCLKATCCRNLYQFKDKSMPDISSSTSEDLFRELGKTCILEEVALGWGFSSFQLEMLKPSISKLRAITLGLGASLDNQTLSVIPEVCPQLESVILNFQVISDNVVRKILQSLKQLQMLWLCCCLGDLTSFSLRISNVNIKTLKLEWVTPWMTNTDLVVLTENCPSLVELSLSGCKLLDSSTQEIISSGWPGLTLIHFESCGKVTAHGVSSLFNCKAVEDLLLRHNGRGIGRNVIYDAASKLPLLRKLALDLCDACDGGFDGPNLTERLYMRNIRISRCMSHKCGLELQSAEAFKPVHKETIVMEWTSAELRTIIVKERI
ncbi:BTB/POZ domain-containing protein FBL11 isoform X2 [Asparagus officinalis]|uniref:BTB/POZ domain-containing protein FBL11 isoform X2 n=1 Tax=Asparagus officinalis TaxID=4686 RepID=UPI00098E21DA|nr:BTB/POZ domain-containing protein FBL11 isoform X2 [Asparagus officinalis]